MNTAEEGTAQDAEETERPQTPDVDIITPPETGLQLVVHNELDRAHGKGLFVTDETARKRDEEARRKKKEIAAGKKKKKDRKQSNPTPTKKRDQTKKAQAEAQAGQAANRVKIKRARPDPTPAAERPPKRYKPRIPNALREIRKYQRSSEPLIRRLPFQRLVKEVSEKVIGSIWGPLALPYRWTAEAVQCIQTAAEDYVSGVLEDANFAAVHSKRVTLQDKDIKLARRIRGDFWGDKIEVDKNNYRVFQAGAEIAGKGEYDERNRRIPGTGFVPKKAIWSGSEARKKAEYDALRQREASGRPETGTSEEQEAAARAALEEQARQQVITRSGAAAHL